MHVEESPGEAEESGGAGVLWGDSLPCAPAAHSHPELMVGSAPRPERMHCCSLSAESEAGAPLGSWGTDVGWGFM